MKHIGLIIAIAILAVSASASETAQKVATDVRVVVDISGSMKKNDPENLRIPAVQLFSQLLPPDSQSGVWTFGQYVNMLVPLAPVTAEWKKEAVRTSEQINSAGLYTNIGGAIERATFGWDKPDETVKRSLILLTDGMVDISRDADVNTEARRKLLEETLHQLKEAGVIIHTIALSGDADQELLSEMAASTDGWYQKVLYAEQLQKVFLKIFGQATERDSVPLVDNVFIVDDQITEFTLLVFKSANANQTVLHQPDGTSINSNEDSAEVSWFESEGYDVITVSGPQVGKWRVEAEVDPDNQVLVVSNIKVKSSEIPNNLLANERINYQMHLNQNNERITEADFLDLIHMELEATSSAGSQVHDLLDDGNAPDTDADDGIYSVSYTAPAEEGIVELTTMVESPTFQRLRQTAIRVFAKPVTISHQLDEDIQGFHTVLIQPIESIIKPELMVINAQVTLPDGVTVPLTMRTNEDLSQRTRVEVFEKGGIYQFQFDVEGFTQNDRVFKVRSEYQIDAPSLVIESKVEAKPEEDNTDQPEELPADDTDKEYPWGYWFSIAGGVNAVFLLLWGLIHFISKKSKLALAKKLGAQLEISNG